MYFQEIHKNRKQMGSRSCFGDGRKCNTSVAHADEANANSLLKAMSDYLASQKAISFYYDSNLELVSTQQQKIALAMFRQFDHESP